MIAALFNDPNPIDPYNTLASVHLSAVVVSSIIGVVIPVVVGLVTKCSTRIKGIVNIALNAVQALLVSAALSDGSAIISQTTFVTWLIATASSVVAYVTVYRPLAITSSLVNRVDAAGNVTKVPGKLADVGVK